MIRPLIACAAILAAPPVLAETIAFAQGPELTLGVGLGPDPEAARAAAIEACGGDFCAVSTTCSAGVWSAVLYVDHVEGVHWNEVYCGFESRAAIEAAAPALCDATARPDLDTCDLAAIYDPDGQQLLTD